MVTIRGSNYIAGLSSTKGTLSFSAINPTNGLKSETIFYEATRNEIQDACRKADLAFLPLKQSSTNQRSQFLIQIARVMKKLMYDTSN